MNRIRLLVSVVLPIIVSVIAGCTSPTYTYRYKLTLEALVDGEVMRASNVVEVGYYLDIANSSHGEMRGEALYFDLGAGRRPLIALLGRRPRPADKRDDCHWGENGPRCLNTLYGTAKLAWNYKSRRLDGFSDLARQRGARDIDPKSLPDLVTFADINDSKTVIEVDPEFPSRALASDFSWRRITIEITDDPLTRGIETRLTWLVGLKTSLGGKKLVDTNSLADNLGKGSFKRDLAR